MFDVLCWLCTIIECRPNNNQNREILNLHDEDKIQPPANEEITIELQFHKNIQFQSNTN